MGFRAVRKATHDNGRNWLAVVQLYSKDFWTQSSSNFSLIKTVRKKTKTKLSFKKIFGGLSFRDLGFRSLSFRGLSFRGLTS